MTSFQSFKSYYIFIIYVFIVSITSCQSTNSNTNNQLSPLSYCSAEPVIDGFADAPWENIVWNPIDQLWVGKKPSKNDFQGEYKVMWNEDAVYVLAKITDDKLIDTNRNPLKRYWDDDCLEIFIDEDGSKGNHQFTHNAFAYHISLDQQVADIGPDKKPHLYPHNLTSAMKELGNNQYLWEVKINMYKDDFIDGQVNKPSKLTADQRFGFAIAYCDNDDSPEREHFIGSSVVEGEDKNRGWIDAGIFGQYFLEK